MTTELQQQRPDEAEWCVALRVSEYHAMLAEITHIRALEANVKSRWILKPADAIGLPYPFDKGIFADVYHVSGIWTAWFYDHRPMNDDDVHASRNIDKLIVGYTFEEVEKLALIAIEWAKGQQV